MKQKEYLENEIVKHREKITSLKENQRSLDMELENEKLKAELKTKNEQVEQLNNKLKDTIENKENFDKNLINDCSKLPVTSSKKHTTQYFNRLTKLNDFFISYIVIKK